MHRCGADGRICTSLGPAPAEPDETVRVAKRGKKKKREVTEEEILAHLDASQDYVFQLRVGQLLSHIDLSVLFDKLPNLSRLSLTYGVNVVGMSYQRSLFGMKMVDASTLAVALKNRVDGRPGR